MSHVVYDKTKYISGTTPLQEILHNTAFNKLSNNAKTFLSYLLEISDAQIAVPGRGASQLATCPSGTLHLTKTDKNIKKS